MTYLNYVQSLIKTAVDSIVALLPSSTMSAATDVSTSESNIRGVDSDTLKTLSDQIDLITSPVARKTVTFSNSTGTVNVFTVTGFVKIKLHVRCKTDCVSAGGCNASLGITGSTAEFIANTDITTLDAGEIWNDTTSDTKVERYYDAVFEYDLADGQDIIITLSAQTDSGVLEFAVEYLALSSDGAVVAA